MNTKVTLEDLKEYIINWLELWEKDWLDNKDMWKAVAESMKQFNNRK